MGQHKAILQNFSACPLCSHFLASLLALLGKSGLDDAVERGQGPWLAIQWQPAFAEVLSRYYDWRFEPTALKYRGHCPSCLRRIVYSRSEEETILELERQPGLARG